MGFLNHFNVQFNINPPPTPETQIAIKLDQVPLLSLGLNIPVEISTPGAFLKPPNPMQLSSIVVMGHFDTGASSTSIDISLAQHLKLVPIGASIKQTAGGPQNTPDYYIDLSFPSAGLRPFHNLKIGSCTLPFVLGNGVHTRNFGILIGRDIMARWNIVWNGPSSTVIIND